MELIIAAILVSVLAAVALPSFQSTVQNNQMTACTNKLIGALQYAKSEAVTSKQTVLVVNDAISAIQPAFRVGSDGDGNGIVEDADLMQGFVCDGTGITITPNPDIAYGPTGFRTDGNGQVNFTACNTVNKGNQVTVSNGGGITTTSLGSC